MTPAPQPVPPAAAARPAWLPPHVPFGGDWNVFVRALYLVFERDFKNRWPRFRTFPVWHDRRVLPDGSGREESFWHLITRDEFVYDRQTRRSEKQRLPDLDRAGRLPWAKPIIEHETAGEILAWDFDEAAKRGGTVVRTYVWLKDYDYVVILERQKKDKGDIFLLITSFLLDCEGKRRDLQSRYERRRK
jgi:hypothetical protein